MDLAFSSGTGLGICHTSAHPLGTHLGAVHGTAPAAVLSHVMAFNLPASTHKLALVASSLGVAEKLIADVMGENALATLKASEDMLPTLVRGALDDTVIANIPRVPSDKEVEELLLRDVRFIVCFSWMVGSWSCAGGNRGGDNNVTTVIHGISEVNRAGTTLEDMLSIHIHKPHYSISGSIMDSTESCTVDRRKEQNE